MWLHQSLCSQSNGHEFLQSEAVSLLALILSRLSLISKDTIGPFTLLTERIQTKGLSCVFKIIFGHGLFRKYFDLIVKPRLYSCELCVFIQPGLKNNYTGFGEIFVVL